MQRSTERILTTHAGRLPNPDHIAAIQHARVAADQATFDRLVTAGVADRVRKQMELRNDIHRDGEFWKARDAQYYHSRVTGVDMQPLQPGEWPSILGHQQERHMPEFRDFYAVYDQLGNIPRPGVVNPPPTPKAVITGPMQYKGQSAITHELAVVKAGIAAAGVQVEDFFFPVLGPPITVEVFRQHADLRLEATNWALRSIPEERVRYHTCWGSWHTPHTTDILQIGGCGCCAVGGSTTIWSKALWVPRCENGSSAIHALQPLEARVDAPGLPPWARRTRRTRWIGTPCRC